MLEQDDVSKLLNRTLTTAEVDSFDVYLQIATERLEQILGISLCDDGGSRIYPCRYGYSSLYIDPCTSVTTVEVDGVAVTDYVLRQNDRYNGEWYNVIEFTNKMTGSLVDVTASWGFSELPQDLALFLAQAFNQVSVEQTADNQVKSKSIEGFNVTYTDRKTFDEFIDANQVTISKYSQRNTGVVRHGYIRPNC